MWNRAVLMIGFLSLAAQAQPPGGGEGRGLISRLNLTDVQERQFTELTTAHRKSMVRQQSEIRLAQIDLEQLMDAGIPDRSAITAKMREISDLRHQLNLLTLDHLFNVEEILDPQQKETWREHHRGRARGNHPMNRDGRSLHDCGKRNGTRGHADLQTGEVY